MELYVVRHGESVNNSLKAGGEGPADYEKSADPPLTPLGEAQAERAARALVETAVERVYCSPQIRGLQTGAIIADRLGVPVEARPNLRERAGGRVEYRGLPVSEIRTRFPRMVMGPAFTEEGWWFRASEPKATDAAYRRGLEVVEWLWSLAGTYRSIALISHGAFGARMMLALLGLPADSTVRLQQANCGIGRVVLDAGFVRCDRWNDTHHLFEGASDLGTDAAV